MTNGKTSQGQLIGQGCTNRGHRAKRPIGQRGQSGQSRFQSGKEPRVPKAKFVSPYRFTDFHYFHADVYHRAPRAGPQSPQGKILIFIRISQFPLLSPYTFLPPGVPRAGLQRLQGKIIISIWIYGFPLVFSCRCLPPGFQSWTPEPPRQNHYFHTALRISITISIQMFKTGLPGLGPKAPKAK
jgi:hypothetical protein